MKGASWKRYAATACVGIALFLILMLTQGGFTEPDPAVQWRIICDALFVPGALLAAFGLLLLAADGGVFDMLKFSTMKLFSVILPKKKREAIPKTFYDYKMEREAKERVKTGHFLAVGIVFLVLAGLALMMYSQYDPLL